MKKEVLGTLLAILAAVISGIAIPVNKIFVVNLDPTVFTAIRAVIIGVAFFIIASFKSKFNYKKFNKVSWRYLLSIAVIGGAFAFILFFNGLSLTTASRGAFLQKTLPLYVIILAFVFLKEKITKKYVIAIFLMVIGTLVLYFAKISPSEFWKNPSMGDILIIAATFLWAVENVIAKKAMIKGETNFVVSFARMFFGGLIIFGVLILMGKYNLLLELKAYQIINILVSTAILFGYVFCWYWSIKLINVSKASVILLLAPVVSIIFGVLMLNEPIPPMQLVGSAIILIGAYFIFRVRSEFY
jgi:drug/metabolite transporter (DMT)-like permease